ncbi:unnamed protein product [Tilletia controversa]|uniref:Uncharacterized protein n=2 Tax=Tilletia TaxID=13289 RepID=A0A177V961_9BASI|nr:hypothetical protein CF336_g2123 [Tilletia laevis]KAE8202917.1 hypothetical protein CF328_g1940 [Tilletia controversa]KAE8263403.1 hypothetical protein A4X03_0g1708 [Tilletia caries]CAD6883912.1 unnamed protein product [Tilletia caries]CAD6902042.1 unnamed protein product [Tilletia laevis]
MSQARRMLIPMDVETEAQVPQLELQAAPLAGPSNVALSPHTPLPALAMPHSSNDVTNAPQTRSDAPDSSATIIRQQSGSNPPSSGFGHFTSSAMRSRSGIEVPVIEIPSVPTPRASGSHLNRSATRAEGAYDEDDDEERVQAPQRKRSNARSRSGPMPILDIDEDDMPPEILKDAGEKQSDQRDDRQEAETEAEQQPKPDVIVISDSDGDYDEAASSKKAKAAKRKKAPAKEPTKAQLAKKKKLDQAEALRDEEERPKADTAKKGSGSAAKKGRKPKAQAAPAKSPEPEAQPEAESAQSAKDSVAEPRPEMEAEAEAEADGLAQAGVQPAFKANEPDRSAETAAKQAEPEPLTERRNKTGKSKTTSHSAPREQTDSKPSSSFWGKPLSRILGAGATKRPGLSRKNQIPALHTTRRSPPPPKPKLEKKVKKTRSEWSDDGSAAEEEDRRKRELGEDDDDDDGGDQGLGGGAEDGGEARPGFEEEIEAY